MMSEVLREIKLRKLTLILFIFCVGYVNPVVARPLDPALKNGLAKGHLPSCLSTLKAQAPQLSEALIRSYCYCLSAAYFGSFTTDDYAYLRRTGFLPPHINNRRGQIQESCAEKTYNR